MSHRGLLLLLEGPLQSWGTQGRFSHRETDFEPSKSGVLGMVGAALGMRRDDEQTLLRLAQLSMAVRVDREGRLLRDYHTAGGGTFRGQPHSVHNAKGTVISNRFYLMDACFVVALSGEEHGFIGEIVQAFERPTWPLFLGRRSCVPTRKVFLEGPRPGRAHELLRSVPWQGSRGGLPTGGKLRCVVEDVQATASVRGRPRADVPRSFQLYARRFDSRFIRDEWLNIDDLPGEDHVFVSPASEQPVA